MVNGVLEEVAELAAGGSRANGAALQAVGEFATQLGGVALALSHGCLIETRHGCIHFLLVLLLRAICRLVLCTDDTVAALSTDEVASSYPAHAHATHAHHAAAKPTDDAVVPAAHCEVATAVVETAIVSRRPQRREQVRFHRRPLDIQRIVKVHLEADG